MNFVSRHEPARTRAGGRFGRGGAFATSRSAVKLASREPGSDWSPDSGEAIFGAYPLCVTYDSILGGPILTRKSSRANDVCPPNLIEDVQLCWSSRRGMLWATEKAHRRSDLYKFLHCRPWRRASGFFRNPMCGMP